MTEKKLTARQANRRNRIIEATEKLTIERGYDGATVREIAAIAGVTEMTIYNLYGNKANLVATLFRLRTANTFELASNDGQNSGLDFLRAFVREIARSTLELPKLAREGVRVLLSHPYPDHLELSQSHIREAVRAMHKAGMLRQSAASAAVLNNFRYGVLMGMLLWSSNILLDSELEPFLMLKLYEILSPHALPPYDESFRKTSRSLVKRLQR